VDAHETDQYILHQSQLQSVFFRQQLRSTVNVIDLLKQEATEEKVGVGQRIFASIELS
jgi:hypothetical protein